MPHPRDLLDAAKHPAVRACYDYWCDARSRSDRDLPGRRHIDPVGMGAFLPYVILIDVVREGGHCRFRYRLVGSHVAEVLGRDVTGKFIEHTGWLRIFEDLYRRYSAIVDDKVLAYGVSLPPDESFAATSFEHLTLPLASDGRTVDMLFGVCCALPLDELRVVNRYVVAPPRQLTPAPRKLSAIVSNVTSSLTIGGEYLSAGTRFLEQNLRHARPEGRA